MRTIILCLSITVVLAAGAAGQEQKSEGSSNLRQYFSGKIGFYKPGEGLNNGLLFGADGITEFVRHNFFLSLALDAYIKRTLDFFGNPKPDLVSQMIVLLPLHANFGYEIFEASTADTRGYAGLGAGYFLYFYDIEYRSTTGGIFGSITTKSESKTGGNFFVTVFARVVIGKVFVEPRAYVAVKDEDTVEVHPFTVDPSGFAITLGVQY